MKSMLEYALEYRMRGFSVIPLCSNKQPCKNEECSKEKGHGKRPLVKWSTYQEQLPTEEEIKKWWKIWKNANIGIVTGKVSGIVVLDIDPRNGGKQSIDGTHLPETVTQKTGGNGVHYFFKYQSGIESQKGFLSGVDLQSDKAYIVIAPSIHKSGETYEFYDTLSLDDVEISPVPEWIVKESKSKYILKSNGKTKSLDISSILNGVSKGERDETLFRIACKFRNADIPQNMAEKLILESAKNCKSDDNAPVGSDPFPGEIALEKVERAYKKYEPKQDKNKDEKPSNTSDNIINAIDNLIIKLFHDEFKKSYIKIKINNHEEILSVKSQEFELLVGKIAYETLGKTFSSDILKRVIDYYSAKALYEGEEYKLNNRVTWYDDSLYYDLTSKNWEAVKITRNGWSIDTNPPILFRRYSHQQAQVTPISGGDLEELRPFINLAKENDWLLFKVALCASFIVGFPHPVLVVYGSQGAAKSTLFKLIRQLLDPSKLNIISYTNNLNELSQTFYHNWFIPLDNLSSLPVWLSDAICRAVTGEGYSKRELFSDDRDIIFTFQRVIGLNGINLVADKPDLLDRSILFEVERIEEEKRISERELWDKFNLIKPKILGAIFDILSKALSLVSKVKLKRLPRMADFCLWGVAIAQAMGYSQEEFLKVYENNLEIQNNQIIQQNPIAQAVINLLQVNKNWQGTATELLEELTTIGEKEKIDTRSHEWAKSANSLVKKLNIIKTNLSEGGITVASSHTGRKRIISLSREEEQEKIIELPSHCSEVSEVDDDVLYVNDTTNSTNDTEIQPLTKKHCIITISNDTNGCNGSFLKGEEEYDILDYLIVNE